MYFEKLLSENLRKLNGFQMEVTEYWLFLQISELSKRL